MLLRVLLDLLEVLVVAVLGEPGNDVTRGPVDLERVGVLIVYMVLAKVPQRIVPNEAR